MEILRYLLREEKIFEKNKNRNTTTKKSSRGEQVGAWMVSYFRNATAEANSATDDFEQSFCGQSP
jgi:hypothetical protein